MLVGAGFKPVRTKTAPTGNMIINRLRAKGDNLITLKEEILRYDQNDKEEKKPDLQRMTSDNSEFLEFTKHLFGEGVSL